MDDPETSVRPAKRYRLYLSKGDRKTAWLFAAYQRVLRAAPDDDPPPGPLLALLCDHELLAPATDAEFDAVESWAVALPHWRGRDGGCAIKAIELPGWEPAAFGRHHGIAYALIGPDGRRVAETVWDYAAVGIEDIVQVQSESYP